MSVLDVTGIALAPGRKTSQHLAALTVSLLMLSGGMAMGWTSAAAGVAEGDQGFTMSSEEWSWVGSVFTLGAVLGCVVVGALLRGMGCRPLALMVAPILAVGWALLTWAGAVWMLLIGRALVGAATGASSVIVPIFTSEIAECSVRGALGIYFELMLCSGILVIYLLGGYVPLLWMNICCCLLPVIFAVSFLFFPESPRYLLLNGNKDEAKKSLLFYRGPKYDVDAELRDLSDALQDREEEPSLLRAFTTTAARRGLLLAVGCMFFQQFSGIDGVTFYASQIFADTGTSLDPDTASMLVGAMQVIGTFISFFFVDRMGRRFLLLLSGFIMSVCCFIMGVYLFYNSDKTTDLSSLNWLPVVTVAIYFFTFSIGFGPVPWLFVGEIFPDQIKGIASSVANVTNWFCAFLVTKFFSTVNNTLGVYSSFWIFGSSCALALVFVFFLLPETKEKTLDEIQHELTGSKKNKRRNENEKNGEVGLHSTAIQGNVENGAANTRL